MGGVIRALAGVAGAGAVTLAYAAGIERNAFVVRRFEVPVLPRRAAPIRVLQLTDLHLMPGQRRKIAWVRALAWLEPNLVLNTGDNLAHQDAVPRVLEAMEPFLDRPGAFVLGSNDYWGPRPKNPFGYFRTKVTPPCTSRLPTDDLVRGLASGGWLDLTNRRGALSMRGVELELVGVDDPHLRYDRYDAVQGPADPDADLTVGVVHAPYARVLDAMVRDGAGLVMAGHTHGGQVAVPFYGALVTNCDLDTRRAKGVSRWWPGAKGVPSDQAPDGAAWMHVSAGLGTSPWAPVRFACRPEATLMTLVSGPRSSARRPVRVGARCRTVGATRIG